jgi:hypothetical protein|tara:strand:+ start:286 stop:645 length:360 start_codon:yes stop_codon:yes gene_type:complete
MLDKIKNIFSGKKKKTIQTPLNEKEIATKEGQPYVKVLDTKVDADNPKMGYFELDWNKHFVLNLKEHGFSGNSDEEIVDHWFSVLCNTIATEGAPMGDSKLTDDIVKRTVREDGKTEIS